MPNRNVEGNYRYAYQGQEKDPETGKEAFELRLWDSRIGRWLTTDPYSQYYSSYLGMGNNPINGVDPDGGIFKPLNAKASALWEKYKALISQTDRGKAYIDLIENDESFVVYISDKKSKAGTFAYNYGNYTLHLGENLTQEEIEILQKDFRGNKIHSNWINAGHELYHIIQHYNFDNQIGVGAFANTFLNSDGSTNNRRVLQIEKRAVHFQNYLYSVTSNGDNFRRRYTGIRVTDFFVDHEDFNPKLEKINTVIEGYMNFHNFFGRHFIETGSHTFKTYGNEGTPMRSPRYFN